MNRAEDERANIGAIPGAIRRPVEVTGVSVIYFHPVRLCLEYRGHSADLQALGETRTLSSVDAIRGVLS